MSLYPQPCLILYPVYFSVQSRVQFKLPFAVSGYPKKTVPAIATMWRAFVYFYHPPSPAVSAMALRSPPVVSVKTLFSQPMVVSGQDLHDEGSVDPVYHAKSRVINQALQEIGMGKYQVRLSVYLASWAS